jgi:molecular chaperone GrpE
VEVVTEETEELEETEKDDSDVNEEKLSLEEKVEKLEQEIDDLKEEKGNYRKQLQRLKADFMNYRKRIKKEKEGIKLSAQIEIIEEILPIIDNFERALNSDDKKVEFKEGVQLIHKQLLNSLKQTGLEKINSEGKEFDPKYHEAIMQIEDSDSESGIVVEEIQKGYMYDDKVIRPAMVKVAE